MTLPPLADILARLKHTLLLQYNPVRTEIAPECGDNLAWYAHL
ncbi:hypothetical protein [Neisseria shayeganii]|nr:hypothetical protein [Neisseria shayeganii]